ncbi:MAG: DUF3244 domain-containing protein [Bacteroidales bacterium]|nr:DUF3244 domain-containing protein [Bacteroidales bacterium]
MNRTIKILLTVFCLLASTNFGFAMREGYGEYEIDLQGELKPIGRSQTDPITASVDVANLYVDFHADLGSLTITISSATGAVVHTENTVAYANDGVQISLSNLPSGNYLVVFSNAQGSLMGKFSI